MVVTNSGAKQQLFCIRSSNDRITVLGLETGGLAQARSEPWTDEQETGRHVALVPGVNAIEYGGRDDDKGPSVRSVLCVCALLSVLAFVLCVWSALWRCTVLLFFRCSTQTQCEMVRCLRGALENEWSSRCT